MKITTALKQLNKAILAMPEYKAIVASIPTNYSIEMLTLVEHGSPKPTTYPHVKYNGLEPKKGQMNEYLIECCGLGYFQSNKSIKEISQICETAYQKVKANPHKDSLRNRLAMADLISDELEVTDEVYPHMREHSIGVFKVNDLK